MLGKNVFDLKKKKKEKKKEMSKKANMKTVVEVMALGGQERRVVKSCVRSSAAMSACHSRAGCVFYSLGDASPQCNPSAHLAISQVQDPFILKSKQLTLLYSFMSRVFVERIPWAPAAGRRTVAVAVLSTWPRPGSWLHCPGH